MSEREMCPPPSAPERLRFEKLTRSLLEPTGFGEEYAIADCPRAGSLFRIASSLGLSACIVYCRVTGLAWPLVLYRIIAHLTMKCTQSALLPALHGNHRRGARNLAGRACSDSNA